ncbi:MAG: bifunctional phosphopantothenoylcysteine decarboxylase/phosphopantothenate--cysteine ligase CoaBC [Porphyromonas sp.]|nr:bifunctional phosphopantothenoylcysteine decarboxylase/phosphopantothenate--cysteine ligase CoaBC [Porphyromonas sp.]
MSIYPSLAGKHIIVGITGSIAAYKAVSLCRLLIKAGAEVQVVITPSGKEFVTPLTLSTITSKPVINEFFSRRDGSWHSHVDLGLWADALVIAPASASSIGKMAHGVADNMLITTYLSCKAPIFIAPAMDLDMYKHPSTQGNIEILRSYGNTIIEAQSGELASHLVGKGRMEEPEEIARLLDVFFTKQSSPCLNRSLVGRRALITAGPTHEAIDPVRFIGNQSTGKMGIAIADALCKRGASVDLVLGPSSLRPSHPEVRVHNVTTALEMRDECLALFDQADIAVMSAAVADYRPAEVATQKIKREDKQAMEIRLVANPDIAATLGARKKDHQILVGFALETQSGINEAKKKIERKGLDAIVLNSLQDEGAGFGGDTNKVTIIDHSGDSISYPLKSKECVAEDIADFITSTLEP